MGFTILGPFISAALALLLAASAGTSDDPRLIIRQALRAVEGDTVARVRGRWAVRLRGDPSDRAAALGLATLARLTYDYPDAERRYQALFTDSANPDRYAVYARLGLAEGLETQGRTQGVVELFTRARIDARALGDREAEGAALYWKGHVLAPVAGADPALAFLDSALAVLPPDALDLKATIRCRRAHILVVTGRPRAAAERSAAMELVRRSGEPRSEVYCLRALFHEFDFRGELDSVLAVGRRLEELRRRTRDRSGLAFALALRADKLRNLGNYGDVLHALREADAEARASRNFYVEAVVSLGLGAIALALNDHPTAAERVERAIVTYEMLGDTAAAWQARHFRSLVSLSAGDLARARRQIAEAIAWERRTKSWYNMTGLYQQLAHAAMAAGDWPAAEAALDSGRAVARRGGVDVQSLAFDEARLALHRGDLAAAERLLTAYLKTLHADQRLSRYEGRARRAEVYARRGELARAERELTLATDELDAWRERLSDPELRVLAFQASGLEHNDRHAGVPTVLAALASGGRVAAAFALAERRRARELADRLTRVRALRVTAVDTAAGASVSGQSARTTAAEIAAAIPDDRTAILEYVTGIKGAPTTVFVLRRSGPGGELVRARVLPPADSLVRQIARLVALIEGGQEPGTLARALGAALLDAALEAAGPRVTRLIVVPDGPLHRLPWDALRMADGRSVVERYAVSIAPSAAVLAALWRGPRDDELAEEPVRLLALGDPAFAGETNPGTDAEADPYRSTFARSGGLARLKTSAREARAVARYAQHAEVRLREEASEAYLKRAPLDSVHVLHLATHALVHERSVAHTAIALAPGDGEDGFLRPSELAALPLGADLVVLSACRTAGGVVVDGEGVQGLTAPFLEAGTRAVVATGWRIGDRSTVAFVRNFYDALARGLLVTEALRHAKLDALRRGAPPSEWAAFTAVGDPLVTVPLRAPARTAVWWAAGAALALVLGAALVYSVRRRSRRMKRVAVDTVVR